MLLHYLNQGLRIWFGRRAKLPTYIIFFVTSKCNAKCHHCFFWKNLNKNVNELSFEEIKKLSLNLNKISHLSISGGEPFLREDLPKICELFYKNNKIKKLHIPTNGLMPKRIKNLIEEILMKCNCDVTLSLSLDGLKNTHDSIRGMDGCFSSLMQTYKEIPPLKERYPHLKVSVNTVISNQNYKELKNLVDFVKKNMPQINEHGFDWVRGSIKNSTVALPPLEEIKNITSFLKETRRYYSKKRKNFAAKLELSIRHYLSDLKFEILKNKKQIIPCRAGDLFAVIYPEGDVSLCELLPTIGNLRKYDIKTIWNSKKAEEQRKYIKEKKCYCTHGCFQPPNAIHYPPIYHKILKYFIKD